jgi:RNA polymerase-binding protein DksA
MNSDELRYFKNLLLNKRKEILGQMESIMEEKRELSLKDEDGDHSSYAYHLADMGTDSIVQEDNFYFTQRNSRLLYHIEEALDRIEKGKYGKCEECSQPIAKIRLEALPHARLCIECKSKEDKGTTYDSSRVITHRRINEAYEEAYDDSDYDMAE